MYNHLVDQTHTNNPDLAHTGSRRVLPSTHVGSPRHMQQLYQDAVAIISRKGKPKNFLTFTTNPNWPEIQNHLNDGQDSMDRPDLIARVFEMKSKQFIQDLTVHCSFGKHIAYVAVNEYQKRRMPHIHVLLFVDIPDEIFFDGTYIDQIVSA